MSDQVHLMERLRRTVRQNAPVGGQAEFVSVERAWLQNLQRLRRYILEDDPRRFITWGVVLSTMFVSDQPYILTEFKFLRELPDWRKRWSQAIRESPFGEPIFYSKFKKSSENLIHHAYHVARWEQFAGIRVDDLDVVLEFGGGYGSMARLFHNLGFRGTYVIYDLPLMSALQRYYLESLEIPTAAPDAAYTATDMRVICVSSHETGKMLSTAPAAQSLFIATWSLSEIPITVRREWAWVMDRFTHLLIAYQQQYGNIDNQNFFSGWAGTRPNKIHWGHAGIAHLPGHFYLLGNKRDSQSEPPA